MTPSPLCEACLLVCYIKNFHDLEKDPRKVRRFVWLDKCLTGYWLWLLTVAASTDNLSSEVFLKLHM